MAAGSGGAVLVICRCGGLARAFRRGRRVSSGNLNCRRPWALSITGSKSTNQFLKARLRLASSVVFIWRLSFDFCRRDFREYVLAILFLSLIARGRYKERFKSGILILRLR